MRTFVLASLAAIAGAVSAASAVTVTNFDNFTPTSAYASWETGTITSGATSLGVQATGFGGAFCSLPNVDASGTDTVQLQATVTAGTAGFVVAIGDTSGHEWNYAWYGNPAGTYTFTKPVNTPNFSTGAAGQLDLANIDYIHIQVDPGAFASTPYDVSFDDLSLIVVPEPTSLALGVFGLAVVGRRRR